MEPNGDALRVGASGFHEREVAVEGRAEPFPVERNGDIEFPRLR